jgi:hypothetical protein
MVVKDKETLKEQMKIAATVFHINASVPMLTMQGIDFN